jgi:hypothetical protein
MLTARLDKTGLKILCGRRRCHGQPGYVTEYPEKDGTEWRAVRVASVTQGMVRTKLGWRLSSRARKRRDAGQWERTWGKREGAKLLLSRSGTKHWPPADNPDVAKMIRVAPGERAPDPSGRTVTSWPDVAYCPECDWPNILDRDVLRVDE